MSGRSARTVRRAAGSNEDATTWSRGPRSRRNARRALRPPPRGRRRRSSARRRRGLRHSHPARRPASPAGARPGAARDRRSAPGRGHRACRTPRGARPAPRRRPPARVRAGTPRGCSPQRRRRAAIGQHKRASHAPQASGAFGSARPYRSRTRSAAFSPIMNVPTTGFTVGIDGKIEPSAIDRPSMPRTRRSGSTTARSSSAAPIRHVPDGW